MLPMPRTKAVSLFVKLTAVLTLGLSLAACEEQADQAALQAPTLYKVSKDIIWSSPNGQALMLDIYTPNTDEGPYPVIVMFHGGGWLINDQSIMTQSAQYLASNARYVICNVNYRLLVDNDNTVELTDIINDAFGAVFWVKDFIGAYGGDASRLIVTGDSAGAHLAATIVTLGHQIAQTETFGGGWFSPSYPETHTGTRFQPLEVQAAVLHYGLFDVLQLANQGFEKWFNPFWLIKGSLGRGLFGEDVNVEKHPQRYRTVSPIHNIPDRSEHILPPQLATVGSEDPVVTPEAVKHYVSEVRDAGQTIEYWEFQGRSHAYLDSGSSFESDAPIALDNMIEFLDAIFYPLPNHAETSDKSGNGRLRN